MPLFSFLRRNTANQEVKELAQSKMAGYCRSWDSNILVANHYVTVSSKERRISRLEQREAVEFLGAVCVILFKHQCGNVDKHFVGI